MGVQEHYDNHLSNIYAWMTGDFETAQSSQQRFFREKHVLPNDSKRAIDLGAGHGLQSVSLAKLGFEVVAVDFNRALLEELARNANGFAISIVQKDLLSFLEQITSEVNVIVCMGDTLTHLENISQVEMLIKNAHQKLQPGGKLVLSFRDLSHELSGTDRFIPVRADANRILTCFLEYTPDKVLVHDIIHEHVNGNWQQRVSAYPKIRLPRTTVVDMLRQSGFVIKCDEIINRMVHIIAVK